MGFYDHYAARSRNSLGLKTKIYQAKRIFNLIPQIDQREKPLSVLEIGPGDGYIAKLSTQNNYRYIGIEASEPVADKLLEEGYEIIKGFVPPFPKDIGLFDRCYMLHVIEHLKDMDAATMVIREIREHLNENGRVVIACPDYMRWKQNFYDCDYTHTIPFTKRRLAQLLINEGFEIEYQSIYSGPIFGYKSLPLFWLARLFYPQLIDDLTFKLDKKRILNRGFLTLIPNLIVVARKRSD